MTNAARDNFWRGAGVLVTGYFFYKAYKSEERSRNPYVQDVPSIVQAWQKSALTFSAMGVLVGGLTLYTWNDPTKPLLSR